MKPLVIFLVGPTASGKSELSIRLAKKIGGEIISADSMQVYKGMDIGTAKLSKTEKRNIPHYGIDLISPSRNYSAYDFRKYALKQIRLILKRKKIPIIVGGSGLYVRALLEGLFEQPGSNLKIKKELEREQKEKGLECLYKRLARLDSVSAKKIGPYNKKRIIRALEIISVTGKTLDRVYSKRESLEDLGVRPLVIGIHRERKALYERIEKRVDLMFQKGILKEVKRLSRKKFSRTARQGVGYKEILPILKKNKKIANQELLDIKAEIKQNTRRFAKRQWTWFKKEKGIRWVYWPEKVSASKVLLEVLKIYA